MERIEKSDVWEGDSWTLRWTELDATNNISIEHIALNSTAAIVLLKHRLTKRTDELNPVEELPNERLPQRIKGAIENV